MVRVDQARQRGKVGANGVESVTDIVAKYLLAVVAAKEVVPIDIQGVMAVVAWLLGEDGRDDRQAEFALEHDCKDLIVQPVVGEAAVVGAQGKTCKVCQESR